MKTDEVKSGCKPYALIGKNMRMGDDATLWLGGVGKRHTRIMFVQTCVNKDEYATERVERFETVKVDPATCHCPEWVNLKMYAELCGLDVEDCYVTSLIKVMPSSVAECKNPKTAMVDEFAPWLEEEIYAVKPKIIVCVGKPVFDLLSGVKAKESDIHGLWLYSEKYRAKLYFIPGTHLALKPEMDERYKQDLGNVKSMYDSVLGSDPEIMPINYRVVRHSIELVNLVSMLERENATVLSVDCEWGGQVHVDGMLRSLQIAWSPTDAAYIRFMDEDANYAFDVGYKEAGRILARWLDRPEVKYIGHHLSADLSWMSHWLGLEWYNKGMFDTEFALQACDESLELGLDILALRYTDLGKYDWDLIQYRKKHPERKGTGYEYVPDDILIPYAVKDVIAVYRAWPEVERWLAAQKTTKGRTLLDYYNELLNPFVTNVFTWFCLNGMPVDRERLDVMRELYNWAKGELQADFLKSVVAESEVMMSERLAAAGLGDDVYESIRDKVASGRASEAEADLHKAVMPDIEAGNSTWSDWAALFEHYVAAPEFNIRSPLQMRNWLFKVKKYEPVKTTSQKENGMPSIDWEKVKTYPPAKQAKFTPAVDKTSLEIFASRYDDAVLRELLELNSVGNVCKNFLKPDEVDDDGELIKENGIHYWLTSDDRLCLNHSTTETGRPRSWNPNVLNYPSWLHARLKDGMKRILADRNDKGQLPDKFKPFLDTSKIPTVRSIVMARPGWCIVEADYQTAEMRGLAWLSGDKEMQAQILYPDPNWAYVDPKYVPEGADPEDYVVRLAFPDYIKQPADKEKFLMTRAKDGKILEKYTEDQLWRDENGKIKGPRYDFH